MIFVCERHSKNFAEMGGLVCPRGQRAVFPPNGDDAWASPFVYNPEMKQLFGEMSEVDINKERIQG